MSLLNHCEVIFFLVLMDHGLYVVYIWEKMVFRLCAIGVSGLASFITTDEQLQ